MKKTGGAQGQPRAPKAPVVLAGRDAEISSVGGRCAARVRQGTRAVVQGISTPAASSAS